MNQALEFDQFGSEHLGSENLREAPILDHLEELRWRLVWALGLWAVGSGVAYTFREQLMVFLVTRLRL
jgi:sec-independent protein translocase protein TatC